jgi:hypothetical protein
MIATADELVEIEAIVPLPRGPGVTGDTDSAVHAALAPPGAAGGGSSGVALSSKTRSTAGH